MAIRNDVCRGMFDEDTIGGSCGVYVWFLPNHPVKRLRNWCNRSPLVCLVSTLPFEATSTTLLPSGLGGRTSLPMYWYHLTDQVCQPTNHSYKARRTSARPVVSLRRRLVAFSLRFRQLLHPLLLVFPVGSLEKQVRPVAARVLLPFQAPLFRRSWWSSRRALVRCWAARASSADIAATAQLDQPCYIFAHTRLAASAFRSQVRR